MLGRNWVTKFCAVLLCLCMFSQPVYAACTDPENGYVKCDDGVVYRVFTQEKEKELMKEVQENRSRELEIIQLNLKLTLKDEKITDLNSMIDFLGRRRLEDQELIATLLDRDESIWSNPYFSHSVSFIGAGALFAFWEWARNDGGR